MKHGILSEHKSLRFAQEAAETQRSRFNINVRTKYLEGLGIYRNYNYGEKTEPTQCPICGAFLTVTKPGLHGTAGPGIFETAYYCKVGEKLGTH